MKPQMKLFCGALLFAGLVTVAFRSPAQTQNFAWTVTGTGTETWSTSDMAYQTRVVSATMPLGNTSGCSNSVWDVTAPISGTCYFNYSLYWGDPNWASASVQIDDRTGASTTIFYNATSSGNGSFTVVAGHTYRFTAHACGSLAAVPSSHGIGTASMTIQFPDHYQSTQHTATRTATMNGNGVTSPSDGEKNLGGFYAPPQPQNGGTISGTSYSLAWNNRNVVMYFSDTRTTNTSNPNAWVLANMSAPFGGTPQTIPGRIHLERYDTGGEGIAYHDTDANELFSNWRISEDVDLYYDTNSGVAIIEATQPGEWVKYSVNVLASTNYAVVVWDGAAGPGGTNFIEVDGNAVTGPLVVPNTGSWGIFQPVRTTNVFISAGFHIVTLYEQNSTVVSLGVGNINAIDIVEYPKIAQQPVSQTGILNSTATLSVIASGTSLGYQWFFNSNSIAGATNAVLVLTNLQSAQSGKYYVSCSNAAAIVTSTNATLLVLQPPQILAGVSTFGIHTNRFGFSVSGMSNQLVVIEASTNLFNGSWVPLLTNTLGTNSIYFSDAKWTNYSKRFYRVHAP
jgi:hypothetical protein